MFFKKKDEDAKFYEFEARHFRTLGDDESTVKQKIDALRAERQATRDAQKAKSDALQAHYDAIAAQARAAGDDFLTVEWKLEVARAEDARNYNADFYRKDRREKLENFAWLREHAKKYKSGRALEQELKKIDAKERDTYIPAKEQPDQGVKESYRKDVRDAGITWFLKTAGVRFLGVLFLFVPIASFIQYFLDLGGIGGTPTYTPMVVALALFAMPIESYVTHALNLWKRYNLEEKCLTSFAAFSAAFFAARPNDGSIFPRLYGWLMLFAGCWLVTVNAKGFTDSWKDWRNHLRVLPMGLILLVLSLVVESLVAAGFRSLLPASSGLSQDQTAVTLTIAMGLCILATWWLWHHWLSPAKSRRIIPVSGLIGGAAEGVMRGRTALIGAWWTLVGGVILWWSLPALISALTNPYSLRVEWLLAGAGTAVGAYWFFGRGLGPIASAFRWSSSLPDQAVHGDARLATPDEAKKAARAGPGSSPPIDPGTLNY